MWASFALFAVTSCSVLVILSFVEGESICEDYEKARICRDGTKLLNATIREDMLWLNSLGISDIAPGAFENAVNVKILILTDNLITTVTKDMFLGLHDVMIINLFNNSIASIADGAFDALTHLEELDLSYNPITLGTVVRNGLAKLKRLHLNNNQCLLARYGFQGLSNLELLELAGGDIVYIRPGSFEGLERLTRLDLYGNKLSILRSNTFQGLEDLEELDLSENLIWSLSNGVFKGLGKLNDLWLTGNQIMSLESQGVFSDVPNLNALYLNKNPIEVVDLTVFQDLHKVTIEPGFILNDVVIRNSSTGSGSARIICVPGNYYAPYNCSIQYQISKS